MLILKEGKHLSFRGTKKGKWCEGLTASLPFPFSGERRRTRKNFVREIPMGRVEYEVERNEKDVERRRGWRASFQDERAFL